MNRFDNYVALDLETTGLEPRQDDIIEIAAIKVRGGEIVDRFESFVYTPLELSEHISFLTGITPKHLEGAPDFIDLIPKIEAFIGDDPLVGHNIWFDWNFLNLKGVKVQNNALWDTYLMSTLLYPDLPSNSLETNTKYFGIAHEDSHRAMSDVIASHELWKVLLKTFPEISAAQRQRIADLERKSSWPLLPFFLRDQAPHKQQLQFDAAEVSKRTVDLSILKLSDQSILIHAPGSDPVAVAARLPQPQKTLYLGSYQHGLHALHQAIPQAVLLFGPQYYASEEKLAKLLKKNELNTAETLLLLRLILLGSAKSRDELGLSHPEQEVWREVQEAGPQYPARQAALESQQVITSHFHAFSDLDLLKSFPRIVVLDPHLLEANATTIFGKALYLDQWQRMSEAADWRRTGENFFTDLDKLGNSLVPASTYAEEVALNDTIITGNEFVRLKSSILALVEQTKDEALLAYLKYFQVFFQTNDSAWVRWISVDPVRGVSLHVAPLSVNGLLEKYLFQGHQVIVISDTADSFPILPELEKQTLPRPFPVTIQLPPLEQITGTKKEGDHQAQLSYLAGLLPTLPGKTGVIFTSKANIKRYFFDLVKVMPDSYGMFAEHFTGSKGKLQDRYMGDEHDRKALFISYRGLRTYSRQVLDFDTIIVHAIPFDYPDPVHKARGNQFDNGFIDYSLPLARQNLLEIAGNFSARAGERKLIMLDRRVQERDYGAEVTEGVG
ncbi:MAG: exonuclease domain-containing protein [bacterium]|nr:exonuclease domain-containing protein [bacterium]